MNVIFPMAGEGARFGYTFKPFLKAGDSTFIEEAKKRFDFIKPNFIFVFRKSQEERWNVSSTLESMFPNDNINCCIIDSSTGALDTAQQARQKLELSGPAFICDCDHSIDIGPMIHLLGVQFDFAIPIWEIKPSEYSTWGKAKIDSHGRFVSFHEKDTPECTPDEKIVGVIGCHLLSEIRVLDEYTGTADFSTMYKRMPNAKMIPVIIKTASFFGTPKLLEEHRFSMTHKYNIFIDIDGTIVDQETKTPLPHALDTLTKWRDQGHKVILTTASTIHKGDGIPHDGFISGLTPGPRIVINDRKPYLPYYTMADGQMVKRNGGIHNIDLSEYSPPRIIKELKGCSGDRIFVVEGKKVRKYSTESSLRRQYEDLKRLSYILPDLVPKVYGEKQTSTDYYYDMEYLEGYAPLSTFDHDTRNKVTAMVLDRLATDLYCFERKLKDPVQWILDFMNSKIYPKIQDEREPVVINGTLYPPIVKMLSEMRLEVFAPTHLTLIHGDLTHENILYKDGRYKLIDPAGANYIDARELDLGKLMQSVQCHFERWDELDPYEIPQDLLKEIRPQWINPEEYDKALFYMFTWLVRITPFMAKKSETRARLSMFLATFHLHRLYLKYRA